MRFALLLAQEVGKGLGRGPFLLGPLPQDGGEAGPRESCALILSCMATGEVALESLGPLA